MPSRTLGSDDQGIASAKCRASLMTSGTLPFDSTVSSSSRRLTASISGANPQAVISPIEVRLTFSLSSRNCSWPSG